MAGIGRRAAWAANMLAVAAVGSMVAAEDSRIHTLPLLTPGSNLAQQGFVRIINRSPRGGQVRIHAIDDTGERFGPVTLSLDGQQARHFTSGDLENGNLSKGLSAGVGDGSGNWRLELATDLDIEPLAYIRTEGGFLTSIHETAAETKDGPNLHYGVPTFNPGSNRGAASSLRLVNLANGSNRVEILGRDDDGGWGRVHLTLSAGAARMLSAQQLEQGDSGFSGRLGDGSGKWRLTVSSDLPLQVLSVVQSRTGHITNLSRGQGDSSIRTTLSDQFDLAAGNEAPDGITYANGKLYVVDRFADRLYAYSETGERDASVEFAGVSSVSNSDILTYANGRFHVVSWDNGYKVLAYTASGMRDTSADFEVSYGQGITYADGRFYILIGKTLNAYTASGRRDAFADIDLAPPNLDLDLGNRPLGGITYADGRFYVVDLNFVEREPKPKVYAYTASGGRDASADFDLVVGNESPWGITYANGSFYVVDQWDAKVYVYTP